MENTGLECPKCGADLLVNNFLFVCEKEKDDTNPCDFKIWKKNKLLSDEIDELIFQEMNSEDGYKFDRGVIRIDVSNPPYYTNVQWNNTGSGTSGQKINLDFHLDEITSKDGRKFEMWKAAISSPSENADRKYLYKNFLGHNITETEAKQLFAGEIVVFENLTSQTGKSFSSKGKLNLDESTKKWKIDLIFDK